MLSERCARGCYRFTVPPLSPLPDHFGPGATPAAKASAAFDPSVWTGRVLQAGSDDLEIIGLALLYPALEWSVGAPGHHGYPRASDLILGKALRGRLGHQITGATARPFLHLLNPTRRPRQSIGRYGPALTPRPISHALRSCGPAPRPSRRSAPACWQEQLLERCDAAVSPRP